MKKNLKSLAFGLVALLGFSSCSSSDDPDTIIQYNMPPCFSYVTDMAQNVSANGASMTFTTQLNYTKMTADIVINGLELTDNTVYPTITLTNVPWTIDADGWKTISGDNLTCTVNGFASSPVFTNFRMKLFDRVIGEFYNPGFDVTFTLDNRYRVFAAITDQFQFGTTVSKDEEGKEFKTIDPAYVLTFNTKTMRAAIEIKGARFAQAMPSLDIMFDSVPFTLVGTTAILNCESLTPTIGGVPYPAFPITNLNGTYNFNGGLELEFNCGVFGQNYEVEVDCKYGVSPK